eukprot:jgi/Chlat1/5350/Chrsp35S05280
MAAAPWARGGDVPVWAYGEPPPQGPAEPYAPGSAEAILLAAGGQLLHGPKAKPPEPPRNERGVRFKGWRVQTRKHPILNAEEIQRWAGLRFAPPPLASTSNHQKPMLLYKCIAVDRWEAELGTSHMPEMVFGNSVLELVHEPSGIGIYFNALNALKAWRQENLPPVQVSVAAEWQRTRKTAVKMIVDYDYTFTTPYAGTVARFIEPQQDMARDLSDGTTAADDEVQSVAEEVPTAVLAPTDATDGRVQGHTTFPTADAQHDLHAPADWQRLRAVVSDACPEPSDTPSVQWEASDERIDMAALQARDPILFYDEVVLYEDELADNGVGMLSAKVRVMPKCWFVLLRYWLRIDGTLMRLRDTRVFCSTKNPSEGLVVLRERSQAEETFESLRQRGANSHSSHYGDAAAAATVLQPQSVICDKLLLPADKPSS